MINCTLGMECTLHFTLELRNQIDNSLPQENDKHYSFMIMTTSMFTSKLKPKKNYKAIVLCFGREKKPKILNHYH